MSHSESGPRTMQDRGLAHQGPTTQAAFLTAPRYLPQHLREGGLLGWPGQKEAEPGSQKPPWRCTAQQSRSWQGAAITHEQLPGLRREAAREARPGPEDLAFTTPRWPGQALTLGLHRAVGVAWWPREFLTAGGHEGRPLGHGASVDSKGEGKDCSANNMKIRSWPPQSKTLHQAKLENFQQRLRDLCFNRRNY